MLLRGILFLIISKDFLFSAIISKIQASKLPTVSESQAPMHNGQFGKRPNSIAVFRAQEAGTREQSVV